MANQHNFNRQYKPISGDFYDELESAATLGQNCEITYKDQDGSEQSIISPIKDLFTEGGIEYARLENRIIPLNSIISINGKTSGGGPVHTEILEQNRMPADAEYISPVDGRPPHETPNTDVQSNTHDNTFKGNIGDIGKTGIPSVDNGLVAPVAHGSLSSSQPDTFSSSSTPLSTTNNIHQSEVVKGNLLGMPDADDDTHNALIVETPVYQQDSIAVTLHTHNTGLDQHTDGNDFVHGFTTSTLPFVVGENELYQLNAHRMINRLDLVVKQSWYKLKENMELGANIARVAPLMAEGFTMLIDMSAITPDADGTIMSPAIANKNILFNSGLAKVAELVPYNCDTLVHGQDSISVNSVRLRYFKDIVQAEHWLNSDPVQIGTPDDMDLN